jgi:hypothetical protein
MSLLILLIYRVYCSDFPRLVKNHNPEENCINTERNIEICLKKSSEHFEEIINNNKVIDFINSPVSKERQIAQSIILIYYIRIL